MKILVTGAAGFIGFHLCKYLLNKKIEVIGLDNFNSYYDPSLKRSRAEELYKISRAGNLDFKLFEVDIAEDRAINKLFQEYKPKKVVNLAAQAGVRYSIDNPAAYINSNIVGFGNILEACRHNNIEHLIFASSSSVYGGNTNVPFSVIRGMSPIYTSCSLMSLKVFASVSSSISHTSRRKVIRNADAYVSPLCWHSSTSYFGFSKLYET